MTQASVKSFQQAADLSPVSGTAGPITERTLESWAQRGTSVPARRSNATLSISGWLFPLAPLNDVAAPSTWTQDQGVDLGMADGACRSKPRSGPDRGAVGATAMRLLVESAPPRRILPRTSVNRGDRCIEPKLDRNGRLPQAVVPKALQADLVAVLRMPPIRLGPSSDQLIPRVPCVCLSQWNRRRSPRPEANLSA
jgi:hypothetical protein